MSTEPKQPQRVPWPQAEVAINLGDAPLDEPQRVERVLELVGDEPEARQAGRARWRYYLGQGLQPVVANAPAVAQGSAQ